MTWRGRVASKKQVPLDCGAFRPLLFFARDPTRKTKAAEKRRSPNVPAIS
jgi:hypothetical protein